MKYRWLLPYLQTWKMFTFQNERFILNIKINVCFDFVLKYSLPGCDLMLKIILFLYTMVFFFIIVRRFKTKLYIIFRLLLKLNF